VCAEALAREAIEGAVGYDDWSVRASVTRDHDLA
jgi:hypothetical protein